MDHRLQNIEARLEKIESKQDQILEEITNTRIVNERNTTSLVEHIKRSDMLEEELTIIRSEMKPIEKHVAMVSGALKLLGILSLFASITVAMINIVKLLN